MSRDSEKAIKAAMKYLSENATGNESEEELNDLLKEFIVDYNSKLHDDNVEFTVDDYLEMAEEADSDEEELEFINLALDLDPDNIDAQVKLIEADSKTYEEEIERLNDKIEEVKLRYKDDYKNSVGEFYMVFHTRPIIRLYYGLMVDYIECNMLGKARDIAEEILRLNENDNLGARYNLIGLYAYFEEEDKALELVRKYGDEDNLESQFLLNLAILYYKKCDFVKSEEYIKQLNKTNKNFKKFAKSFEDCTIMDMVYEIDSSMYQRGSLNELVMDYVSNRYLYNSMLSFFDFAQRCLKKKPAKKKTNNKKLS